MITFTTVGLAMMIAGMVLLLFVLWRRSRHNAKNADARERYDRYSPE